MYVIYIKDLKSINGVRFYPLCRELKKKIISIICVILLSPNNRYITFIKDLKSINAKFYFSLS